MTSPRTEDFERHRSLLFPIGAVGYVDAHPASVVALDVADGRRGGVRIVVNLEKLRAVLPSPRS